ncbi:MAG: AraC family transcriptional regulator [Kiloniellaceae bacterium]
MAELLAARGRAAEQILQGVGLKPADLEAADAQIPFARYVALLQQSADHLNDPCFGLHHGAGLDPLDAGAIGYLAANSPTLKAALDNYLNYLWISTQGLRVELAHEETEAQLRFELQDPNVERSEQWYESVLAAAINICRFVVGRRITPKAVTMKHRRETHLDEFRKYFGVPVAFGAPRYTITLSRDLLSRPCHSADARLFRIVRAHCEDLLKRSRQAESFREEVELLVGSLLPTGTATAANVAATLGMSERTLSRRLADEGKNFRQVVEEQRRKSAFRYLDDSAFRPAQIAYLLGYSEPSAFTHAFRRWTGQSPSDYRGAGAAPSRHAGESNQ